MTVSCKRETKRSSLVRNERGVALLIVLLVTALLIALIFEFAYATRISLNSAVNFRDSQRAYFLARAGVSAFMKFPELRDAISQGEWGVVPIISEGDTQVMIKWEDETGKLRITDVKTDPATQVMVRNLFETVRRIDTSVYDRMTDQTSDVNRLTLLSGLHEYMGDEDFSKVGPSLTVSPVPPRKININAASRDVLQSLGISETAADFIVEEREKTPYEKVSDVQGIDNIQIHGLELSNYLTVTPGTIYKVFAYATVGGYTKQVEAVVNGNTVSYWRAL